MSTESTAPPTGSPRKHSIWRSRNLVIALIVCTLVNLCISLIVREIAMNSVIPSAVKSCNAKGVEGVTVSDDSRRVLIDTIGQEGDTGATDETINCLLDQLQVPVQVISSINNTNNEQGMRSAGWDGFRSEWAYDCIVGHQLTVERA